MSLWRPLVTVSKHTLADLLIFRPLLLFVTETNILNDIQSVPEGGFFILNQWFPTGGSQVHSEWTASELLKCQVCKTTLYF